MAEHILIVDDEDTLRYFLKQTLEDEGYRVSEAASGHVALDWLGRESIDLLLVDLRMADMDGLEVMRQFRQRSPETQVIILTGYASVPSVIEALRQGAHDYLTKPVKTAELLTSVADGLARRRAPIPSCTSHINPRTSRCGSGRGAPRGGRVPRSRCIHRR